MTSVEESQIDFSVVIALLNHGGHWEESIKSWAREQDYPRDRYEVIVLSNGKRACEGGAKELLCEQDSLVITDLTQEMEIYDHGLRMGRGKYLFIAEAHSIGTANCLSEMMNYLVETGKPGAMCESAGLYSTLPGLLQELVFKDINEQFKRPDFWFRIALRGTAILKSLYLQAGGLKKEYLMFADNLLSIDLHRSGVFLGFAHKAIVKHYNVWNFAHIEKATRDFVAGECLYRENSSEREQERYIGISQQWRQRLFYHPGVARHRYNALKKIALRRIMQPARWAGLLKTIPDLLDAMILAMFGAHSGKAASLLKAMFWKYMSVFLHAIRRERGAKEAYIRSFHIHRVEYFRYKNWLRKPPELKCASRLSLPMSEDLDDHLVAFHSVEQTEGGKQYRWTQPLSMVIVRVPAGDYVLAMEDAGCRPENLKANLAVFFNQQELKRLPGQAGDNMLRFEVNRQHFSNSEFQHLTLVADCLQPSKQGSHDKRKLGIPIVSIEFQPLASEKAFETSQQSASNVFFAVCQR